MKTRRGTLPISDFEPGDVLEWKGHIVLVLEQKAQAKPLY